MIGLDTNVLLRLYLADDAKQTAVVKTLFAGLTEDEPGYVNVITLVELIWTLRDRYKVPREKVVELVSGLLESRDIVLEDEAVIELAIDQAGANAGELPDLLIALRNAGAGCTRTVTFDKGAAKAVSGMELLS